MARKTTAKKPETKPTVSEPTVIAEGTYRRAEEKRTCWKYEHYPTPDEPQHLVGKPAAIYVLKDVVGSTVEFAPVEIRVTITAS